MFRFDIPLIDLAAIGCAIAFPATRWLRGRMGWDTKPDVLLLLLDILRGASFFPFLLLIVGTFSTKKVAPRR